MLILKGYFNLTCSVAHAILQWCIFVYYRYNLSETAIFCLKAPEIILYNERRAPIFNMQNFIYKQDTK